MSQRAQNSRCFCPFPAAAWPTVGLSARRVALRGHWSEPARLIPAGMVVSTQCIKDCIKKDMIDPFTEPPASCTLRRLAPLPPPCPNLRRLAPPSAAVPYLPPPCLAAMRALCPSVVPGRGAGEAAREGHYHAARRGHRLRIQDGRKGAPATLVGRLASPKAPRLDPIQGELALTLRRAAPPVPAGTRRQLRVAPGGALLAAAASWREHAAQMAERVRTLRATSTPPGRWWHFACPHTPHDSLFKRRSRLDSR